ncbi:ATP-binding protein [Salinibacillus xinjiangensis]|nr:AAA family ATPase [Salinibacillus xinjiangensis]
MFIEKVQIYGFGKWNNESFTLSPSLTVMKGPNESGKTSLKQFILYVLFDLPSSSRKYFAPKEGSRFGGRLYLKLENNESVIIERVMDKRKNKVQCLLEDGRTEGEEYLKKLLKGMDRNTYEQIFSFNDQDLQKLQTIGEEDLGKVLFGVGLSGSDNIANLENDLTKKMDELFKKRGKKPIINQQIKQIKELKNKIATIEQQEDQYNELSDRIDSLSEQIAADQAEIQRKEGNLLLIDQYFQAKEAIQQYHLIEDQLQAFQEIDTFPDMGLERQRQIKDMMLPIKSEIHALEKRKEKLEEELRQLKEGRLSEDAYQSLQKVDELKSEYQFIRRNISEKEQELKHLDIAFQQELSQLGWEKQNVNLLSYQFPVFLEDRWKTIARDQELLHEEEERLIVEERQLTTSRTTIQTRLTEYEQQLLPTEAYISLKNKVDEHREAKWKQQFLQEQQSLYDANQQRLKKVGNQLRKLGKLSLVLGFIGITGLSFFAYLTENMYGYLLGSGVFLIGLLIWMMVGKNVIGMEKQAKQEENRNISANISENELQQLVKNINQHEQALSDLKEEQKNRDDIEKALQNCQQNQQDLARKQNQLTERIEAELQQFPFLASFDVTHWPSLYHKVIKLQQYEKDLLNVEDTIRNWEQTKGTIESQAQHIAEQCLKTLPINDEIWEELDNKKENENNKREESVRIQQELDQVKQDQSELYHRLAPYQQEQQDLFSLAQVQTEEEFVTKGKRFEEKQQLLKQQEEMLRQIQLIFKSNAVHILKEQILWAELEQKKGLLSTEMKDLSERVEQQRQELSDLRAEIKQLEENEQLSNLRHQLAFLKNELKEQIRKWATYKTAHSFIKKTKQVYQNEYLPDIVERTTYFFQRLTAGRYTQIIPPMEDEGFVAESAHQVRYQASELSTGTVAQLYVSLRLALSEIMNDTFGVPFLIDDAFVHYDAVRKQEMLAILEEVSEKQQVMYFTWNETDQLTKAGKQEIILDQKATSVF